MANDTNNSYWQIFGSTSFFFRTKEKNHIAKNKGKKSSSTTFTTKETIKRTATTF